MSLKIPPVRGRILVVDDDPVCTGALSQLLTEDGFRVTVAHSGDEALRRIEDDLPDAIVTDLQMPGMDGLRLMRTVRERHPRLPFVVVSGMHQGAGSLLEGEAFAYVAKPFDVDEIVSVLDVAMQLRLEAHARTA